MVERLLEEVIRFQGVAKDYPLFAGSRERLRFHLSKAFGVSRGAENVSYKTALKDISLRVGRGEKVGLIGSNGSGKTTLLKAMIGAVEPSNGRVTRSGNVQALMQTGIGFHEDLSGSENIRNALHLNGLTKKQREDAYQDIVDFVELGEFLQFPINTYSLGMRARLEFATATAIHPDILVIDEVLGAGDGYFAKKCAQRMRDLIKDTTLILVSHSMAQIQDFCDRVIWLEQGSLMADGGAASTIKQYEEFMLKEQSLVQQQAQEAQRADEGLVVGSSDLVDSFVAKLKEFSSSQVLDDEEQIKLGSVCFRGAADVSEKQIVETGDALAFELKLANKGIEQGHVRLGLYALNSEGVLIWDSYSDYFSLPAGESDLEVMFPVFCGGIGAYHLHFFLQKSLGRLGGQGCIIAYSNEALFLRVLETNFSDPAYVHCPAHWSFHSSGSVGSENSRINAWV